MNPLILSAPPVRLSARISRSETAEEDEKTAVGMLIVWELDLFLRFCFTRDNYLAVKNIKSKQ
jgi:hypothetical protein